MFDVTNSLTNTTKLNTYCHAIFIIDYDKKKFNSVNE